MKHLSLIALSLVTSAACTDDGFGARASEVEGIYQVKSHLLNEQSCSPGGDPVQDADTFAFAKQTTILGNDYLMIYSCSSLADCRQKAARPVFEGNISFAFTLSGIDGDALTGFEATTGFTSTNGTCTMPELSDLVLTLDGDTLSIQKSTKVGHDYPSDKGYCTTDRGRAASEDAACSEMETLMATRLESL